jgi:serine phosphatase RsbU (regulator of sigma subunit)
LPLQKKSLPPHVPRQIGSVELASHYRTGDRTLDVGGDWFDAVPVDDGLVLVMGDVEGHDSRAAALMPRLREVTRVAAREEKNPASVLARASAWLDRIDSDRFATALVVHIDVSTRVATVASAGHLAPALLSPTPTGTVPSPLELETGPPLGIGQEWHDRSTRLPADAVLFLYTDGLVETRADDIDEGVRRLGELLKGLPFDARTILNSALELHPGQDEDDVAVLVAHVP